MSKTQKIVLCLMSIVLVTISIITIFVSKNQNISSGSFVRPEFDSSALDGIPPKTIDDELRYQEAQVSENLKLGMCGNLVLYDDNIVDIYLTSYSTNKGYIRAILYDKDNKEIGSTGLVKPNQYVKSVKLTQVPAKSQVVSAKVLTYDEENYYSLGSFSIKLDFSV